MRRWKREKSLLFVILLAMLLLFILFLQWKFEPMLQEMAKARVANRASFIINEAVNRQLQSGEIDYTRMIFLEKDTDGNVTALKTNIAEINRLKTQILSMVDDMLLELNIQEIGLPLGSLILPEFFSGSGPKIPVKVMSVSSSNAEFRNVFLEAGINQTTHQIRMEVQITMMILTPAGTESVQAESEVLVAETVVVGKVPQSYVDVNRG